jgi:prephenate dehydrogenase
VNATVVGLGAMGGSIGAGLRAHGMQVAGYDVDPLRTRAALELGLIDRGAESAVQAVMGVEIVVIATPLDAIIGLLPTLSSATQDDALILDVGSVKKCVVDAMECLPTARRAIGGHPLAGTERSGPEASRANLFRHRTFALCPSRLTAPTTTLRAEALVAMLGATPMVVDAARHDRIVARTSHMPQLLATALALTLEPGDAALAGPALRDMTRLASSDPTMWGQIMAVNHANVTEAVRSFRAQLDILGRSIEGGDGAILERSMQKANASAMLLGEDST